MRIFQISKLSREQQKSVSAGATDSNQQPCLKSCLERREVGVDHDVGPVVLRLCLHSERFRLTLHGMLSEVDAKYVLMLVQIER